MAVCETELHEGVAIFRLNRPPANAIDLEFANQIEAAFADLIGTGAGRAIVVTGTGACFSAGLDLKQVPRYSPAEQRAMVAVVNRMISTLYACPVPVVGAVNGHAIAGGLVLALACDYRVGTDAPCKIGLTEARAGIPFPAAAMAVVRAELSPGAARLLTLLASNIDPQAALAAGVLDELQPPEHVLPTALRVARDLAGIPAAAYTRIKHQLRAPAIAVIEDMLARGTDPLLDNWLTSDAARASDTLLHGDGHTR